MHIEFVLLTELLRTKMLPAMGPEVCKQDLLWPIRSPVRYAYIKPLASPTDPGSLMVLGCTLGLYPGFGGSL